MTFEEYIRNPMGDKNTVMTHREIYRELYTSKYEKVMVRELNKVDYIIYKAKNSYYIYIKVPSEVVPKFYYDVVIKLSPPKEILSGGNNLKNYEAQFFSNDPAFVFTFAHAFRKAGLFIEELSVRMSKKALKDKPKEKNPKEEIAYVKSLYFAYLIMKDKGLFNKLIIDPKSIKYNEKGLISQIMPADQKIEERQEKGREIQAAIKADKNRVNDEIKRDIKHIGDEGENSNNGIRKIKRIGGLNNSIGKMNNINTIGKMNKIGRIKK